MGILDKGILIKEVNNMKIGGRNKYSRSTFRKSQLAPFSSEEYPVPFTVMLNDLALKKKQRLNTILDVLRKRKKKEKEQG
ncbi:MAG: hypothetical protein PHG66_06760 [Candidatus Colwellbacteria bacterium]|nr:hypothetical protein [Candidatus Colwellbacteria bacterium]